MVSGRMLAAAAAWTRCVADQHELLARAEKLGAARFFDACCTARDARSLPHWMPAEHVLLGYAREAITHGQRGDVALAEQASCSAGELLGECGTEEAWTAALVYLRALDAY